MIDHKVCRLMRPMINFGWDQQFKKTTRFRSKIQALSQLVDLRNIFGGHLCPVKYEWWLELRIWNIKLGTSSAYFVCVIEGNYSLIARRHRLCAGACRQPVDIQKE